MKVSWKIKFGLFAACLIVLGYHLSYLIHRYFNGELSLTSILLFLVGCNVVVSVVFSLFENEE